MAGTKRTKEGEGARASDASERVESLPIMETTLSGTPRTSHFLDRNGFIRDLNSVLPAPLRGFSRMPHPLLEGSVTGLGREGASGPSDGWI